MIFFKIIFDKIYFIKYNKAIRYEVAKESRPRRHLLQLRPRGARLSLSRESTHRERHPRRKGQFLLLRPVQAAAQRTPQYGRHRGRLCVRQTNSTEITAQKALDRRNDVCKELQKLYLKYKDKGLEILGFPCNQFAGQEPGSNAQVQEFCRLNYGVTFQIFAKGDVRGENAQPLFQYLTEQQGFQGFDPAHPYTEMLTKALKENFPSYLEGDSIKWNFTKFLVDREGNVVTRFEPTTAMSEVEAGVAACLKTAP